MTLRDSSHVILWEHTTDAGQAKLQTNWFESRYTKTYICPFYKILLREVKQTAESMGIPLQSDPIFKQGSFPL